jgi:hypothetical protein
MIRYRNFQFGWVIVVVFVLVLALITFSYIFHWGNNPLDKPGFIFMVTLFAVLLAGFYGMTVTVTDKAIVIKFGIGYIRKTIKFEEISSVGITQYPVYYGYGIRIIPNGTLFNVSGSYAVELRLKKKRPVLQIGTNDRDALYEVITNVMKENSATFKNGSSFQNSDSI